MRVRNGMVTDPPSRRHCLRLRRVGIDEVAGKEERRRHTLGAERVQDAGHPVGVAAGVEGERDNLGACGDDGPYLAAEALRHLPCVVRARRGRRTCRRQWRTSHHPRRHHRGHHHGKPCGLHPGFHRDHDPCERSSALMTAQRDQERQRPLVPRQSPLAISVRWAGPSAVRPPPAGPPGDQAAQPEPCCPSTRGGGPPFRRAPAPVPFPWS